MALQYRIIVSIGTILLLTLLSGMALLSLHARNEVLLPRQSPVIVRRGHS